MRNTNALTSKAGYTLVYVSGSQNTNASNGQMVFVKKDKVNRVKLLADNCHQKTNDGHNLYVRNTTECCELVLFAYKTSEDETLFVLSVYKHPKMKVKSFYNELKAFLTDNMQTQRGSNEAFDFKNKKLLIIGDFNLDLARRKDPLYDNAQMVCKLISKLAMKSAYNTRDKTASTTQAGTLIDWCLVTSNMLPSTHECVIYDSYFAYHKAIWFALLREDV